MQKYEMSSREHWFQNPWVWLVISIPTLTVLGCALTIYLALSNPDFLVKDSALDIQTAASRQR